MIYKGSIIVHGLVDDAATTYFVLILQHTSLYHDIELLVDISFVSDGLYNYYISDFLLKLGKVFLKDR